MARIPLYVQAVLDTLRFSGSGQRFAELAAEDWLKTLAFCDRAHLTVALARRCPRSAPAWVQSRLSRNLADNAKRWERTKSTYSEIASAFHDAGVDFLVLKGFSHAGLFVDKPEYRPQYDLDLLIAREHLERACETAALLGYEPVRASGNRPLDHLPPMIRKASWQWRGDYFDPELPLSLELHFRFWDEHTERFSAPGMENFWHRRQSRTLDGFDFVALHDIDALGYASLHALRHLLRGDLLPSHVYELAWFLHHKEHSGSFWDQWSALHQEPLRRLEAICFALAQIWFDCHLHPKAQLEIYHLPSEISRWIQLYGDSPLAGLFHPNKDELWLHWNLTTSASNRFAILQRRLFPGQLPRSADLNNLPFIASRAWHHLRALPSAAVSAAFWFSGR